MDDLTTVCITIIICVFILTAGFGSIGSEKREDER